MCQWVPRGTALRLAEVEAGQENGSIDTTRASQRRGIVLLDDSPLEGRRFLRLGTFTSYETDS